MISDPQDYFTNLRNEIKEKFITTLHDVEVSDELDKCAGKILESVEAELEHVVREGDLYLIYSDKIDMDEIHHAIYMKMIGAISTLGELIVAERSPLDCHPTYDLNVERR